MPKEDTYTSRKSVEEYKYNSESVLLNKNSSLPLSTLSLLCLADELLLAEEERLTDEWKEMAVMTDDKR